MQLRPHMDGKLSLDYLRFTHHSFWNRGIFAMTIESTTRSPLGLSTERSETDTERPNGRRTATVFALFDLSLRVCVHTRVRTFRILRVHLTGHYSAIMKIMVLKMEQAEAIEDNQV